MRTLLWSVVLLGLGCDTTKPTLAPVTPPSKTPTQAQTPPAQDPAPAPVPTPTTSSISLAHLEAQAATRTARGEAHVAAQAEHREASTPARLARGRALWSRDREAAIQHLEATVQDLGPNSKLLGELGYMYQRTKRHDLALTALKKASDLRHGEVLPEANPGLAYNLGRAYEHAGRPKEALKSYEDAVSSLDSKTYPKRYASYLKAIGRVRTPKTLTHSALSCPKGTEHLTPIRIYPPKDEEAQGRAYLHQGDGADLTDFITSRVQLNDDAHRDLFVTNMESCGNWGDCMHAALAGCGKSHYVQVLELNYSQGYNVSKKFTVHRGVTWYDILISERGLAGDGDERTWKNRASYNGERYELKK